jgi:hypothetical protein
VRDDEEMQRFAPIEDVFKERHFDRLIGWLFCSQSTRAGQQGRYRNRQTGKTPSGGDR